MSAGIEKNDNMFYVSSEGTPWHGIGTPVDGALTSAEAILAANLDWNVEMVPVYIKGRLIQPDPWYAAHQQYDQVPNRKAV